MTAALVLLCGGLGAITRFAVDALVQSRRAGEFPLGTFVVNVGGCFALGLLDRLHPAHHTALVLGTAAIGSYTTFSTWMFETHRPAQDGEAGLAWLNVAVSLGTGFVAIVLGRIVGAAL